MNNDEEDLQNECPCGGKPQVFRYKNGYILVCKQCGCIVG